MIFAQMNQQDDVPAWKISEQEKKDSVIFRGAEQTHLRNLVGHAVVADVSWTPDLEGGENSMMKDLPEQSEAPGERWMTEQGVLAEKMAKERLVKDRQLEMLMNVWLKTMVAMKMMAAKETAGLTKEASGKKARDSSLEMMLNEVLYGKIEKTLLEKTTNG